MQITEYRNCCTAQIVYEFTKCVYNREKATFYDVDESSEKIVEYLITQCIEKKHGGWATITAITTNNQTEANKALKQLGWKHSRWMSKTRHTESKIRLWWIELDTFRAPAPEVTNVQENITDDSYYGTIITVR
jgi:uncharacterized protein YfdQ (DUF2303 family)